MYTGICQSVVTLVAIAAFYSVDLVFMLRYDRKRRADGSGRSWSFTLMALAAGALLVLQPILLPWLSLRINAWWGALIQLVGLILIVWALLLHTWSRLHLQQFYAERVELQAEHRLVDTGPYRYVRHPLFTAYFLFVSGVLLINPALPTLLVAVYAYWDFFGAAKDEEELLGQKLPGYDRYMACTPRFLPRLRHSSKGSL
jgi:protein-S-isoprenylcysteine O-methyltransferase Ste14